jgi:hypothetical protein
VETFSSAYLLLVAWDGSFKRSSSLEFKMPVSKKPVRAFIGEDNDNKDSLFLNGGILDGVCLV